MNYKIIYQKIDLQVETEDVEDGEKICCGDTNLGTHISLICQDGGHVIMIFDKNGKIVDI